MKGSKVTRLDIAEYLDSEEVVAEYLDLVCKENDPALLLRAIGHIARSKGMAKIAESSGLGRESLYKALDEKAHPRFETVFKVLAALGIQMHLVPRVKFKGKRTPPPFAVAEKKAAYRVKRKNILYNGAPSERIYFGSFMSKAK